MPHLWTDDKESALDYILAGGGKSLQTLILTVKMLEVTRDGMNVAAYLLKHWPNLTSEKSWRVYICEYRFVYSRLRHRNHQVLYVVKVFME